MAFILSCSIQKAEYNYKQQEIQELIAKVFPIKETDKQKLMPIFSNSEIKTRQLAFPLEWYTKERQLQEVNASYCERVIDYSKQAALSCLSNRKFIKREIDPKEIDHILFVSSTGISTPTIDAYLIDELGLRENIKRTPIFGLGCAGGTNAVGKAFDYLKGAPESNVLIICAELCSVTFQHNDTRVSNFVGAALFGDGASALLLVGEDSPLLHQKITAVPKVTSSSTKTKPHSQSVMGWRVVNTGFEVIFKKSIPKLVESFWKGHMEERLAELNMAAVDLPFIVAHPGGKKVIEAFVSTLGISDQAVSYSKDVLSRHGNMSSPTVHFVLHQVMLGKPSAGTKSFMTSLGPGFSSEIVSLEWV
ncbi:putative chalcone synthase [Halobacillus andaensis]|uniref:Chalcone synthase n=1 Tax=Halobacillus andaensis TaxID=1176239 RepID=A0A917AY69_HALAA|nr:3-oxoacyl-[acyl-carrier-protein] synthase III C-terminal domain-containing protein [Halobacillus andaensis]MBP2003316.1 alkylresorcinol/alkylpyrone synthase [Halobacillus andaensis]GGF09746.1 putative chalcone synthase [Halobacillus andaensis]